MDRRDEGENMLTVGVVRSRCMGDKSEYFRSTFYRSMFINVRRLERRAFRLALLLTGPQRQTFSFLALRLAKNFSNLETFRLFLIFASRSTIAEMVA